MNVSSLVILRPVMTTLVMLALLLGGVVGYRARDALGRQSAMRETSAAQLDQRANLGAIWGQDMRFARPCGRKRRHQVSLPFVRMSSMRILRGCACTDHSVWPDFKVAPVASPAFWTVIPGDEYTARAVGCRKCTGCRGSGT